MPTSLPLPPPHDDKPGANVFFAYNHEGKKSTFEKHDLSIFQKCNSMVDF